MVYTSQTQHGAQAMNISNQKTSLKYRFTSQWLGCPESLYRVPRYYQSGEPCADPLPASPEALPPCVSVSENKAGQGVN
jgi:hypothetical protein